VLSTYATVLVILASLAVLAKAAQEYFTANRAVATKNYAVGDRFPDIPGLPSATGGTLVLWLRTTCRFCTESMPFYTELVALSRRARIVAVGDEPAAVLRTYLEGNGVVVDAVLTVPVGTVRLAGTPTLVFVGPDKRVGAVWRGLVRSKGGERDQIIRSVREGALAN
jgi:hypothetical protein